MPKVNSHQSDLRSADSGRPSAAMLSRLLVLAAATLPCSFAQQNGDATAWLQFIGTEVRQFRVEVLEQRIADEGERLIQIERDLAVLRIELGKRQRDEQLQKRQVDELEKEASDPNVDEQARAQIQALKTELASNADLTRIAYNSLTARETELSERLRLGRTRLEVFTNRLRQLSDNKR